VLGKDDKAIKEYVVKRNVIGSENVNYY